MILGLIGSFGSIVFEVSHQKIQTIDEFARSATTRWSNHAIIGQKPKSEFLGPELDTITFKVRFDAMWGVNPKTEMDKLLIMCRAGQVETLIVGGLALGVYKWKITSVTQNWLTHDGRGRPIIGVADVTMEEYAG